jgi:hypothetical protein
MIAKFHVYGLVSVDMPQGRLMMALCGVEISGREIRLAIVVNGDEGAFALRAVETKKIILSDEKNSDSIRTFLRAITAFAHENGVDQFVVKDRARGGAFAGGAVSFKIEALLQALEGCAVTFVNAVVLSKFAKTNAAGLPLGMPKYLQDAYRCGAFKLNLDKGA